VHRAVYSLSEEATSAYEGARAKVASFINAPDPRAIVFTRNATEAINLVAHTWGQANVRTGDRIIATEMEHHSNYLPWVALAEQKEASLESVPVTDSCLLDLAALDRMLEKPARLVALTHSSNVLGTVNPARAVAARAHAAGATMLLDAAQSVPHMRVDVQALDCDFMVFSGHKMCGPTGVGVLYGRPELMEKMGPYQTGGGMIRSIGRDTIRWNETPWKLEAGTPAIAEAVALGVAVDYLDAIGMDRILAHERELTNMALSRLSELSGVRVLGPAAGERIGVIAFTVDGLHPHDLAHMLDMRGVAVRAGLHCAQPLHQRFGLDATARASFYLYNTRREVERLVDGIAEAQRWHGSVTAG
jgi:cysteine desulfurase/selenocysteine lyase